MSNIIFEGINGRTAIVGNSVVAIIVEAIAIIYAFILVANKTPNIRYFFVFLGLFLLNALFIFI